MLMALLAMLVTTDAAVQTSFSQKTPLQIRQLRDKWIEAEEEKDIPFLDKLLADDAVIGNSQGQILDKSQFLARMRAPDRILKVTNTRDLTVRIYGDAAILTEAITVDGTDKGKPFGGEFRFIRVFVLQKGGWHVVLGQGTPLKPPSAE
jgi:ketosteroid isomerase-like protein